MRKMWTVLCAVVLSVGVGCASSPPPMDDAQEWLKPPTQRPSLRDVVERVDSLAPNPEKVRTPVLPVNWPPTSDDAHVFLSSYQESGVVGEWEMFAPSHRVDLEVLGEVQNIRGTGQDLVTPIGTLSNTPSDSLIPMKEAEEAMIHVLTGRMTPEAARPVLARYLDWLEAAPHRSIYVSGDASGFIALLRQEPSP